MYNDLVAEYMDLMKKEEKVKYSVIEVQSEMKVGEENLKKLKDQIKKKGYDPESLDEVIDTMSKKLKSQMTKHRDRLDEIKNDIEEFNDFKNSVES